MSTIMPNNLRYIQRTQLAEEQRLMAGYYQGIIRSYGIDVLYIKRDNDYATSGINSDTIYGQQTNATFSLSTNMITYMEVDNSILAINGLGLVPTDEVTFYFSLNDFAAAFANNLSQYCEYPIEPTSGYLPYTTTNISKCYESEIMNGSFSYTIPSGVTNGTNINVPLTGESIPTYLYLTNPYLHTSFASTVSGGYASSNLYLTFNKGMYGGYNRTFYSTSGYVLYSDLQLALKHITKIHPSVGDVVRIDFPGNEQLEEYELTEVFSRRPTNEGVNPLLGKYVWKCKAMRRVPSYEQIENTTVQSENATEDLMDVIKKTQHNNITVYTNINDYAATGIDAVYGGYTAADQLVLDPDRFIDTDVLSGTSLLQAFNNGTSLLTDGYDLYFQSGTIYTNITNNIPGNSYNTVSFPVNTDKIMYLKIKNGNIYFTSSDNLSSTQITNFTNNTSNKAQYSFDYIIQDVNKVQGPANSSIYIFKSDRFALISNGTNLIAINPNGENYVVANTLTAFNTTIGTPSIATYTTSLVCQINNGPVNSYIPLYTSDTPVLSGTITTIFGNTIVSPNNLVGSSYLSATINGTQYYIKVFTGDINNAPPCAQIIGTYVDGTFISSGYAVININGNQQLIMEIFTQRLNAAQIGMIYNGGNATEQE